jgi:hypothetical protein
MTEHILDENTRLLVLVNCSPEKQTTEITLSKGYQNLSVYHGKGTINENKIEIEANQPLILTVTK